MAGDEGDGPDEYVHGEELKICKKCHRGFSGKHKNNNFSVRCGECHKSEDGNWSSDLMVSFDHSGVESSCADCHTPKGEKEAVSHKGEECEQCHTYDNWEDTAIAVHEYSDNCKACHGDDRPDTHPSHGPAGRCDTCHSYDDSWAGGLHEATTACVSCHKKPSDLGRDCESCHQYNDWINVTPNVTPEVHDYAGNCAECHLKNRPESHGEYSHTETCKECHTYGERGWEEGTHLAETECLKCHEASSDTEHAQGSDCETCHTYKEWKSITPPLSVTANG